MSVFFSKNTFSWANYNNKITFLWARTPHIQTTVWTGIHILRGLSAVADMGSFCSKQQSSLFENFLHLHVSFQQKCTKIWKCNDIIADPNISSCKFYSMSDIGISIAFYQLCHRFWAIGIWFYFYRNQFIGATDKKILFQCRIFFRVIV